MFLSLNVYSQWSSQTYDYRAPVLKFFNDIRNAYLEKANKFIIHKEKNSLLFFKEDKENEPILDSSFSISHSREGKWDRYILHVAKYINFNDEAITSNNYIILKTQLSERLSINDLLEFKFPRPKDGEKVWIYYERENFNIYWNKERKREYLGFELQGDQIAIEEISEKNYSRIFNRYSCSFDDCGYADLISESRLLDGFWLETFKTASIDKSSNVNKEISQLEANAILQGPYESLLSWEFKKLQEQLQPFSVDGPITFYID